MTRWTDLAEWVGPTVNQSGKMLEHRGLVIHTAEGYYLGTIAWQKNPDADVSSHFIVAGPHDMAKGVPDGKLAQMVDTDVTAWTQRAGNGHWLSVECSGFGSRGEKLSAAQCEAVAQLLARAHREYGVPLQIAVNPDGRGLGHHSMGCNWPAGAWGHCDCPGDQIIAQKPAIVARALEILNGEDMELHEVVNAIANGSTDKGYITGAEKPGDGYVPFAAAFNLRTLTGKVDALAAAVDELKARPPVQAAPVDVAALAAALRPEFEEIVRAQLDALKLGRVS